MNLRPVLKLDSSFFSFLYFSSNQLDLKEIPKAFVALWISSVDSERGTLPIISFSAGLLDSVTMLGLLSMILTI